MSSRLTITLLASLVGGVATPCRGQETTPALDSTGMPSLELLAQEAGRITRRHAVRAVSATMLCEEGHPLVDSASVAACGVLAGARATSIVAAFAKGLEVPVIQPADADTSTDFATCPPDIEKGVESRVLLARVTAPVVGVRERVWEGRLTVELRCRSTRAERGRQIATLGKSYLYQWNGRDWKMYQFSWWSSERR